MNAQPREHTELIGLIEAILIDRATPRDVARLDTLLESSGAARSIYLDYVDLHACLRRKYAYPEASPESVEWDAVANAPAVTPDYQSSGKSIWNRATAVWLAVAAMLLVTISLQRVDRSRSTAVPQTSLDGVAVLSQSLDVQWRRGKGAFAKGAVIPAGELELDGGIVQLDFYDGAVVVLEGPAHLSLSSSMETRLMRGRLRARVPKRAAGFTVKTPLGNVVDLGTEFALEIDEKSETGELHVIEGEVRFTPANPEAGSPRTLSAGEGIGITATAVNAVASESLAELFVGPNEVESLDRRRRSERYKNWVDWREQLWEDPALVAYYGHSPEVQWARTLRNFAPDGADDSHGVVVGCEWSQGRWPGHKAISFRNASHRVSVNLPGQHDSMTLSAWLKVDRLDPDRVATLIHSEREVPGSLCWLLEPSVRGGLSHFYETLLNAEGSLSRGKYHSLIWALRPDDDGRWVHLAVTYNAETKRVSHYRNGEIIHSIKVASPRPLSIGSADLGNSPLGETRHAKAAAANLVGRLDEMVVVGRALSAEELATLYRVGTP